MIEQFLDGVGNEWFDMRGENAEKGSRFTGQSADTETLGVTVPFYTYGGQSEPVGNGGEGTDWAAGTASGASLEIILSI